MNTHKFKAYQFKFNTYIVNTSVIVSVRQDALPLGCQGLQIAYVHAGFVKEGAIH